MYMGDTYPYMVAKKELNCIVNTVCLLSYFNTCTEFRVQVHIDLKQEKKKKKRLQAPVQIIRTTTFCIFFPSQPAIKEIFLQIFIILPPPVRSTTKKKPSP